MLSTPSTGVTSILNSCQSELRPALRSLVRLGTPWGRRKRDDGLAIETRKCVVLCIPFVGLAAQHREPAERAIANWRSRRSGHLTGGLPYPGLFARLTRVQVGPAQSDGENDESSCHHRSDDNLGWHRSTPLLREHDPGKSDGGFDPDQIRSDNLQPAAISAGLLGQAYERPHGGMLSGTLWLVATDADPVSDRSVNTLGHVST